MSCEIFCQTSTIIRLIKKVKGMTKGKKHERGFIRKGYLVKH